MTTPTKEDKFSFGLWTIGYNGADPFGGPTRAPLPTATPERQAYIRAQLEELGIIDTEPHGW